MTRKFSGILIKVVAQRAGITLDALRAWEKRYGAVAPGRSTTNRRLYSDADVERLILLRKATMAGRSIGRVAQLSAGELEALVTEDKAAIALSRTVLIEQLMVPLMHKVGDFWGVGSLRIAQEHMASAIVRNVLGNMNGTFETPGAAPHLIVTTPSGQRHEFGALIAVTTAAALSWRH